jgi:transcription antitermination factor NusB
MRKRSLAREYALKILYQAEICRRDIAAANKIFWSETEKTDPVTKEYADKVTLGIKDHVDSIDEKISQYATNWQLKRMAVIDRNILRLGVYELLFAGDIPPKVAINEAVELAKKYGDMESSKFVNGILDKVHKKEAGGDTDDK